MYIDTQIPTVLQDFAKIACFSVGIQCAHGAENCNFHASVGRRVQEKLVGRRKIARKQRFLERSTASKRELMSPCIHENGGHELLVNLNSSHFVSADYVK